MANGDSVTVKEIANGFIIQRTVEHSDGSLDFIEHFSSEDPFAAREASMLGGKPTIPTDTPGSVARRAAIVNG